GGAAAAPADLDDDDGDARGPLAARARDRRRRGAPEAARDRGYRRSLHVDARDARPHAAARDARARPPPEESMNIASIHPAVVHFAIALLVAGVLFRVLSLALRDRAKFMSPAAATLILVGVVASIVAAKSGVDAHGRAEH